MVASSDAKLTVDSMTPGTDSVASATAAEQVEQDIPPTSTESVSATGS